MKKSALISDLIFTLFASWLFTLCIFRYLGVPLISALILSGVCGLLTACAFGSLWQSKRKILLLKRSDEALKEKLLLHLALISDEQKSRLFSSALSLESEEGEIKPYGRDRLQSDACLYLLKFRFTPVTADEIARFARQKTTKRKILLCSHIEESAFQLCHKLGIEPKTGDWAFLFLKKHNALPEHFAGDELPEGKAKRRFKLCFAKSNSRRFLVSSIFILLLSFITPFPYYYLVFGLILLCAAVFIRIFGYA